MPTDGGEPQPLLERATTSEYDISPDGQWIVARSFYAEAGEWRVDVIPADGSPTTRTLDTHVGFGPPSGPASRLRWSPDGLAITFVQTDGGGDNIWSRPLDGGPGRQLTYFDAATIRWFDWSPDGTELVAARGHTSRDLALLKNFR